MTRARGLLEFGVFGALALGLHVGLFAMGAQRAGAVASGAGGEDLISLEPADAATLALIADWERITLPEPDLKLPDTPPEIPVFKIELPELSLLPPEAPTFPPPPPDKPLPNTKPLPKPDPVAKPVKHPQPKAESRKPSAAAPAARAAGSGGGASVGAGGQAQAGTLSKARTQDLRASWGAAIRARIERRKTYPSAANGASGKVTVRLKVTRAGVLAAVSVVRSSGNAALDQAALQAVKRAGKFPAAPKGLSETGYDFSLAIQFSR
ncbi:energy transducer TonB family protein [Phaeovulum sp.]|uniref:energy transducer TonB family protein n=1 Tax=Phaeovulum sp. TaxID=2934796 RepID=UPI0039E433F9